MGIIFNEKEKLFKLDTPNTSYVIGIVGSDGFLGHAYYGKKLSDLQGVKDLMRIYEAPFTPDTNARDRLSFLDCFPTEYSGHGVGDYRESSIRVKTAAGHSAVQPYYVSHEIYKGKRKLEGLPATFGAEDAVETLAITCMDPALNLQMVLEYSVFADTDAIARSVKVTNLDENALYLEKVMSGCLDMDNRDFDLITLHGSWARERHMQRLPLGCGKHSVGSLRGESGHQEHPFMAVLEHTATQTRGDVYGFHFVYSGNFQAMAEVNQFNQVRVLMGIQPEDFCWKLEKGESFQAPEMIMTYSANGIGGMSRSFHELYRNHLIRSPYKNKKRPILINNWEATYFDFNEEKLLDIAKEASQMGIEMLVMDDGWFGNRCDDNRALGDWEVNEDKLKGGLKKLVDGVNALGMEFGIWFEPEMISPESKLYEEHPDWAIAIPGRTPGLARNQFVLDISRKEVRDCIVEKICKVLHSANIKYVKWDMNRPLSDIGSACLPADRQGELYHRFVLGMYEMQERMLSEFPDLLLENCSGGGARFDPGMLYYSPQIWCSDDTDAIERLAIQESTSMIYPLSSMGAHVSVCPNHTVGRNTPFETRGYVALAGTFGYELDVTKLSEEDKAMVPRQVAMYHQFNDLVREGDYYRIASYQENHLYDCFQVVSKDKKESLVFFVQVLGEPNMHSRNIRLQGLDENAEYALWDVTVEPGKELLQETEVSVKGDTLMYAGMQVQRMWGDFKAKLFYFKKK
ncbi:MAG: alpha-galactosidase [Lachnospiraceae bacterium]|nr:alpha-galactosidase [Lachnospiraceae bacterium]